MDPETGKACIGAQEMDSRPVNLTLVSLFILLTGLEIGAAVMIMRNGSLSLLGAALLWIALFVVYAKSLDQTSITVVTVGWIVTSQLAAVAIDRWLNGILITPQLVIGVVVMLGGVLIMFIPSAP